jgi:protein gp37
MTQLPRIKKGLYWDRALSLVEGCMMVSPGCQNCWSAKATGMRCHQDNEKMKARYSGLLDETGKFNGTIRLMWDGINKPKHVKKPTTWAVWNDLFHENVFNLFILETLIMMNKTPQHTYLILTKRPERAKEFFNIHHDLDIKGLSNIWLGVTAENQKQADKRIPILLDIPASVRFVSVEPMLEPVDLGKHFSVAWKCKKCGFQGNSDTYGKETDGYGEPYCPNCKEGYTKDFMTGLVSNGIDWVIIGAESGSNARKIGSAYFFNLLFQCRNANVPVFVKQIWEDNKLVKLPMMGGQRWAEFPK